jgi:hypothetical protein
MSVPGFTAEVSLYRSKSHYGTTGYAYGRTSAAISPAAIPGLVKSVGGRKMFAGAGMRALFTGVPLGFTCSGLHCSCSGDDDCNDMFSTVCGDIASCTEDDSGGVVCECLRV